MSALPLVSAYVRRSDNWREWGAKYRVYTVECHAAASTASAAAVRWSVYRSLGDFVRLAEALKRRSGPGLRPPTLPRKSYFRAALGREPNNKLALNLFLIAVLESPHFRGCPAVLEFLEVSSLSFRPELGFKLKEGWLFKTPGGTALYYSSRKYILVLQVVLFVATVYAAVFTADKYPSAPSTPF